MGRREGVWMGMQDWIRHTPGTYDYITFGPVTLRTSDLSPLLLLLLLCYYYGHLLLVLCSRYMAPISHYISVNPCLQLPF